MPPPTVMMHLLARTPRGKYSSVRSDCLQRPLNLNVTPIFALPFSDETA
jgi:hypothetical protein